MFDVRKTKDGKEYLAWVSRDRMPGERGHWIEVCRKDDYAIVIRKLIDGNREAGLKILLDEDGIYRALVLID